MTRRQRTPPLPSASPAGAARDLDARLVAGLLAALTLVVFLPTLACGFVNMDDPKYVLHNPVVLGGLSAAGVRQAWTRVFVANWAPLTILSLQADVSLFGPGPRGFHLTNVLIHAAATAVLVVALVRMTGAPGRAAAAVLLFAVHPLRVESVAWISERKDALSVFFIAVALLAYEWYCRRPGWMRLAGVAMAMLASLLAKPMAVSLPLLLLLTDAWPLRRLPEGSAGREDGPESAGGRYPRQSWPTILAEKTGLGLLALVFVVITLATQTGAMASEQRMPLLSSRLPNALVAYVDYVRDTFLPVGLCALYRHAGATVATPMIAVIAAEVFLLLALVVRWRRSQPAAAWGVTWFTVALLPVIGIVQVGVQGRADRYTYVPHIGLMVAIVWTAAGVLKRLRLPDRVGTLLVAAAAGGCIVLTVSQIATWRDSVALWTNVLACEGNHPVAHLGLGEEWFDRGQTDLAIAEFRRALAADETARAHDWLGLALARKGLLAAAYEEHDAATRLEPDNWEAHNNAGIALARMGRTSAALERFEQAARLRPDDAEVQANLTRARQLLGRDTSP